MSKKWSTIIRPKKRWLDFNFKELWAYKDLIKLFVRRDFVAYYKQTILGPIWFFIQPIFTTVVFMVIFGSIAKIPTSGIPSHLFYLSGIVNWNYFADCLNKTSNTFTANSSIFGKVYFPRIAVPISIVISNLIAYGIQLLLFISLLVYQIIISDFSIEFSIAFCLIPLLLLQMALLGLGVGIIVSSLTTKYKDLSFAVVFGVQLWMYATPVVYSLSQVPERLNWIFNLNPMAPIIEIFRSIFFDSSSINWLIYANSWGITLLLLFFGLALFNRVEKSFMDTI